MKISCDPKKRVFIFLLALCFAGAEAAYTQQQSAAVFVKARVKQFAIFLVDATDAGWGLSGNEISELGNVDARGSAISGAPAGNPDVNGIVGIPVNAAGAPMADPDDPNCIGAFYPLFSASGGNNNNQHPNSAICIFLLTFQRWRITTSAQLLGSTTNVTLGQLKWKMDGSPSSGFQNYIDFTPSEYQLASGSWAWGYYYVDYGLLVEYEDGSGPNTWLVTYTLVHY